MNVLRLRALLVAAIAALPTARPTLAPVVTPEPTPPATVTSTISLSTTIVGKGPDGMLRPRHAVVTIVIEENSPFVDPPSAVESLDLTLHRKILVPGQDRGTLQELEETGAASVEYAPPQTTGGTPE